MQTTLCSVSWQWMETGPTSKDVRVWSQEVMWILGKCPELKPCSKGDHFRNKQPALPLARSLAGTALGLFCSVFLSITRLGQQCEWANRATVIQKESGLVSLLQHSAELVVSSFLSFWSCYPWASVLIVSITISKSTTQLCAGHICLETGLVTSVRTLVQCFFPHHVSPSLLFPSTRTCLPLWGCRQQGLFVGSGAGA